MTYFKISLLIYSSFLHKLIRLHIVNTYRQNFFYRYSKVKTFFILLIISKKGKKYDSCFYTSQYCQPDIDYAHFQYLMIFTGFDYIRCTKPADYNIYRFEIHFIRPISSFKQNYFPKYKSL